MKTITTSELAKTLAGGDSYIRTKNGEVKGLAITPEKNPEAPEIIIVGKGPRITKNAKLLLNYNQYVPLFMKKGVNSWEYKGKFKAMKYDQSHNTVEKYRKHRNSDTVDGILFLKQKTKTWKRQIKLRYLPLGIYLT